MILHVENETWHWQSFDLKTIYDITPAILFLGSSNHPRLKVEIWD